MAVPHHLDDAVKRLEDANLRIDLARAKPTSMENLREWMEALTAYVRTLAEVHEYTNESVHEKIHALAGRVRLDAVVKPHPSSSH
jgi:hypothetical protein